SKAGLVALCRGIAREYASNGIRTNLIAPGIVDVGMAAKQWREEPDYQARAKRAIPLGRLQHPAEVAKGIAFLLSDDASYMTGSTLLMDGGASLYPLDPEDVS
ncbi:MAG: SDR family NAD(P)-dependent oxidoreductase, partial [bacterium]